MPHSRGVGGGGEGGEEVKREGRGIRVINAGQAAWKKWVLFKNLY